MHTYTALFDNREDAEAAQSQLRQLGILDGDDARIADQATTGFSRDESGSTGGDQGKGFWDSLKGAVLPDDDRRVYEAGVAQGGYLLTVNVDDQNAERVHDLLENSRAVDIDEREQQYRQTGVLPPAGLAVGATTMGRTEGLSQNQTQNLAQSGDQSGDQSIPVVEEQLRVGKRQIEGGGVRVRSYVVETPVQEQVRLRQEHVEIERRPVDQSLNAANLGAADDLFRERTVELTETSEEAVVGKEARVVEEVVVHKEVGERLETVQDTVRHTEVDVERLPGGSDPTRR